MYTEGTAYTRCLPIAIGTLGIGIDILVLVSSMPRV